MRRPSPHPRGSILFHLDTIPSLDELDAFLSEGRKQQHKYTTEEQRAIDEKRVDLMRKGKR